MAKLRLFDQIETEMEKVKLSEWELFDFGKYEDLFPNQTGTILSFEILLLYCKISSLKGNHHESIFRLYKLLYSSTETRYKLNKQEFQTVLLEIVNVLLRLPDYQSASLLLEEFLKKDGQNVDYWSALGRLQLQSGLLHDATNSFEKVHLLIG